MRRVSRPTVEMFRQLYDGVGAQWDWTDMHRSSPRWLKAFAEDRLVHTHLVVEEPDTTAGFAQLDLRRRHRDGEVGLAYFGLLPDWCGRGLGRWALAEALARAWRGGTRVVTVNTCTLDHPSALPLYRQMGFEVVREVERIGYTGTVGWRR